MKSIKPAIQILIVCFMMVSLTSFGVLSAVITPTGSTGMALESVTKMDRDLSLWIDAAPEMTSLNLNAAGSPGMSMESFLSLTPAKYKQMTGKRLGFFKSVELKIAQNQVKKKMNSEGGGDLPKWAYIVLSIIALGWLAIGVKSAWKGNDWWIALLLYFLFIIPGIIYSLIVMKKYY